MPTKRSPRQVLEAFYQAERTFMQNGGTAGRASFDDMAATLSPSVVLHQSPDLPFGGEYVGHERYKQWADAMSAIFDRVDARDPVFFEKDDTLVISCTLVTRIRASEEEISHPMVQLVTVKDGRITEFRPFYWNVPDYSAAASVDNQHAGEQPGTAIDIVATPSVDEANLASLKRFYEAEQAYMNSDHGSFSQIAATLDPECVIFQPSSLPYGGEWRGHSGFELWMKAFAKQWSYLEVKDSELFPYRDIIFSSSHVYAKARVSGQNFDWLLLQSIKFRNARILELRPFYWDTAALVQP